MSTGTSGPDGTSLSSEATPIGSKAVTITEEPEHIPDDTTLQISPTSSPKIHRASISGKKMTGRPAPFTANSSTISLGRTVSYLRLEDGPLPDVTSPGEFSNPREDVRKFVSQLQTWLKEEKEKRTVTTSGRQDSVQEGKATDDIVSPTDVKQDLALDKLETIINGFVALMPLTPHAELRPRKSYSSSSLRRGSIAKAFKRSTAHTASSDTEWAGEDINVPHVEASLDNSRTLAFTGGAEVGEAEAEQQKDAKHWIQFKKDIVRLTHTLKIRGWRKIPIEKGEVILVERLSGALTNAVYVVKPPKELPEPDQDDGTKPYISKSRPKELLLRVYGPQVEHLIDRDTELGILARLARKRIGPRLLGYFTNGRFEEYLHATTLTAGDIRIPDTSKQIAKRMRELHDGIDLLPSERHAGPKVFNSWDSWVGQCEKVITWLDLQVKREREGHPPLSERYTRRGLICGTEWPMFKKTYDKYRKLLIKEYGGKRAIQDRLVFAHNDAQYGNLMRLTPAGESPLLQPANQHRQLVVIDFEYAGANTPGYEFVNHFTEWSYDYHDPAKSYACNTSQYPTPQEQHTFFRAYVMHRSQFTPHVSSTPEMKGREKTNISDFMLDARTPLGAPAMDYDGEERAREERMEKDIQFLLHETRLWRIANAANWVAWGIIQAKIPELDDPPKKSKTARFSAALDRVRGRIHAHSDPLDDDVKAKQEASKHDRPEGRLQEEAHAEGDVTEDTEEEVGEEDEAFDNLAYAQDRAMLFWGDCLQMGIVKEEELPESLLKQIKIVKY